MCACQRSSTSNRVTVFVELCQLITSWARLRHKHRQAEGCSMQMRPASLAPSASNVGQHCAVLCCAAGGSVTAGMGIYDAMMLCRADVQTYCFGIAASMGAFLLGAGKKVGPRKRTLARSPACHMLKGQHIKPQVPGGMHPIITRSSVRQKPSQPAPHAVHRYGQILRCIKL